MSRITRQQSSAAHDGLRERAVEFGVEALDDLDTLTLLLSRSVERGARTWAEVLLRRWSDLESVLAADVEDLAPIVGRQAAVDLKLLRDINRRIAFGALKRSQVLSSSEALRRYLCARLADHPREQFRVLFLNKRNQLIRDELMAEGTVDHAPVYPREVVRRALQLSASALVLVHNHPSGDPTPSAADVAMTKEVIQACTALKVTVHDHVIVGAGQVSSMRSLGLI